MLGADCSGLLMLLNAEVPNRIGNFGSLAETCLPWFGLCIPMLLTGALWRRSASALIALLLPVVVWFSLFGGLLGDKSHPGGELTVVSHNVGAGNPDPAGTARDLAASGADVLALEEVTPAGHGDVRARTWRRRTHSTRCWAPSGCGANCRCRTSRPVDTK